MSLKIELDRECAPCYGTGVGRLPRSKCGACRGTGLQLTEFGNDVVEFLRRHYGLEMPAPTDRDPQP